MVRIRSIWKSVVGLALAAALSASPLRAADVDKYLPSDSQAVVFVNVRQILDSPVSKKYLLELIKDGLKKDADAQKFLEAAGLDPLKDISSLTFAVSPGEGPASPKVLGILHGHYDVAKIQTTLDAHAKDHADELKVHTEGSLHLYEAKNKGSGEPAFVAFLDKESLAISPSKDVVVAASKASSSKKVTKGLQELVQKADDKQSVWLVALVTDEIKKAMAANPQTAPIANKLESVTGNVTFTDAVQLDLNVNTSDAKAASDVKKMVDGGKAILMLLVSQNEEVGPILGEVVEGLKVGTTKNSVSVSGKMTSDQIDKAAAKVKK